MTGSTKKLSFWEELERFFLLYVQATIKSAVQSLSDHMFSMRTSLRCLRPSSGALQKLSSASTSTFWRFPNKALALISREEFLPTIVSFETSFAGQMQPAKISLYVQVKGNTVSERHVRLNAPHILKS